MPERDHMINYLKNASEEEVIFFFGNSENPLAGGSLQAITHEGILFYGYLCDSGVRCAGSLSEKDINNIKEKDIKNYDNIFEGLDGLIDFDEIEVLMVRKGCKPNIEYFYVDFDPEGIKYLDEDELIFHETYYEAVQDYGWHSDEGSISEYYGELKDLSFEDLLNLYEFVIKYKQGGEISKAEEDDINSAFEEIKKSIDAYAAEENQKMIRGMYRIRSVSLSPNNKMLKVRLIVAVEQLWDIYSVSNLWNIRAGNIIESFFSPDSKILSVTLIVDNEVQFFDASSGKQLDVSGSAKGFFAPVAFSPEGRFIASKGRDKDVYISDRIAEKELVVLRAYKGFASFMLFSPDGKSLASVLGRTIKPSDEIIFDIVQIWDTISGEELCVLNVQGNQISRIKFSPDGKSLATISNDGTIVQLWDTISGEEQEIISICEGDLKLVDFSPDGKLITAVCIDNNISLWHSTSDKKAMLLQGHEDRVFPLAFNPKKMLLASGSWDKTIRIWDAISGKEIHVLKGHNDVVSSLDFSIEGALLCSGSWDHTVRLWNVDSGETYKIINVLP